MTCSEFLDHYSEFIDHRLSLPAVARVRAHIRECDGCARYHRVMTRGRGALDELPYVEPSANFYMDLRKRLASERRAEAPAAERGARGAPGIPGAPGANLPGVLVADRRADGPGVLVALGVAAALVAIVWSPLLETEQPPVIELPAMTARAPESTWRLERRDAWLTPTFTPARSGWAGTRTSSNPGLQLRSVSAIPTGSTDLFTPIQLERPLFFSPDATSFPGVRPASLSTRR